ncbi:MAG: DUF4179 domain-containing protein, partial [Clostridia bacterium]|nr:DUF4179 domain-containing protein [Clostridia bacterium]
VTEDDIWTFSTVTNGYRVTVPDHSDCRLRFGSSQSLNVSYEPGISTNTKWTYTNGSPGTAQFNEASGSTAGYSSLTGFSKDLYIFKVSMNSALDKLSDTKTSLGYKTLVKASLNTTGATALTMVAKIGSGASAKYYTLAMNDPENIKTMDVTDVMKEGLEGNAIFLFDAAVWTNLGQDYSLVFDNRGLSSSSYHLLSADSDNLNEGHPTSPEVAADGDQTKYTWSLQTFSSGGDSLYLFGYQDPVNDEGVFTYVYFDSADLTFKTTTSSRTALSSGKYVQLYQLGRKQSIESGYQTLEISLEDDGITITSFPLNEVEADDVVTYSAGGQNTPAQGEYMILTIQGGIYYALAYDQHDRLSFADVSLLFNGHFDGRGDLGTYCISVNKRYLWEQRGTPAITSGTAANLTFHNIGANINLSLEDGDNGVLTFSDGQLYSTVSETDYYLDFTTAAGFTIGTTESTVPIRLYAVGANSIDTGDDSGSLQYVYYNYGLNTGSTSGINFNNFSFTKELIANLPKYAMDYSGTLQSTEGWTLIGDTVLTDVNSTVKLGSGITLTQNLPTMAAKFHAFDYEYSFSDEEGETVEGEVSYYAPQGAVAFAVASASPTKPVFVNVIVSTEQDAEYAEDLRYLAVWKVASIDAENESITVLADYDETLQGLEAADNSVYDYAYTLQSNFYTPNFAIPLPNILSQDMESEGSASFVKINTKQKDEFDKTIYESHWLHKEETGNDVSYEHLIAHTFTISSPGVYYLGSTCGSVSVSYLYIGDMMGGEEGEAVGVDISDKLTIDFVWGTYSQVGGFDTDAAVGTIAYVLRKSETESLAWVHSNIYPFMTNGTAGLYTGSEPDGYNPTDDMILSVQRTYTAADGDDPAYSRVTISATTTDEIYDEGNGVRYYNMNTATQRQTRKVTLLFPNQPAVEEGGEGGEGNG